MTELDLIRRLHQHRQWCNRKLREAAAPLSDAQLRQSFDIGRGSLWATLVHLYAAERVWLEALHGNVGPALAGPDAFDSIEQLQIAWEAQERRWQRALDELTPDALDKPVRKASSSDSEKVHLTPASDVLLHVCTHAHYTTAQAVNMLRHLGATMPDTQLITMSRAERAGASH